MTELAEETINEDVTPRESVEMLRNRAQWYRLLAGVFAEEIQAPLLRELRDDAFIAELAETGVRFDDDFLKADEGELLESLATEYTMLFVAPGGFPPVESVRLQGGYAQSASTETRDVYAMEGFEKAKSRFVTFDDHLAVEMQFVGAMLERQAGALEEGDEAEARRIEKNVKRFWMKHPGRWCRGYAGLLADAAEHSFYREMARLLEAFAEAELEEMGLDVPDDDGGKYRAPKPEAMTEPMQCGGAAT